MENCCWPPHRHKPIRTERGDDDDDDDDDDGGGGD